MSYKSMVAWREKNPIRYKYLTLKSNAKRRRKTFTLSLEKFTEIYQPGMTIDRIDPAKGYADDNVQCISLRDNVKKQHEERMRRTPCPF